MLLLELELGSIDVTASLTLEAFSRTWSTTRLMTLFFGAALRGLFFATGFLAGAFLAAAFFAGAALRAAALRAGAFRAEAFFAARFGAALRTALRAAFFGAAFFAGAFFADFLEADFLAGFDDFEDLRGDDFLEVFFDDFFDAAIRFSCSSAVSHVSGGGIRAAWQLGC